MVGWSFSERTAVKEAEPIQLAHGVRKLLKSRVTVRAQRRLDLNRLNRRPA